jgi:hypothetical protein
MEFEYLLRDVYVPSTNKRNFSGDIKKMAPTVVGCLSRDNPISFDTELEFVQSQPMSRRRNSMREA